MVSVTVCPWRAATPGAVGLSKLRPRASRTTEAAPFTPRRTLSRASSSPSTGEPSLPTRPTMRSMPGERVTTRSGAGSVWTPRSAVAAATSVGRKRPGMVTHARLRSVARFTTAGGTPALVNTRDRAARSRTSRGATLSRTSSRLSTSGKPVASRMSPRNGGISAAFTCCRAARRAHSAPCQSCTWPARPPSARAKSPSARWKMGMRLESLPRGAATDRTLDDHDLTVVGHVHAKTLFRHRRESAATSERPDVTLELGTEGDELGPVAVEQADLARLGNAVAAPPNDQRGHEHEGHQDHGHLRAPPRLPPLHHARRQARSFALRARGLRATSPSDARRAFRVTSSPSAVPPQVHTGCRGGQLQATLHSRKRCFTRRSSPEW